MFCIAFRQVVGTVSLSSCQTILMRGHFLRGFGAMCLALPLPLLPLVPVLALSGHPPFCHSHRNQHGHQQLQLHRPFLFSAAIRSIDNQWQNPQRLVLLQPWRVKSFTFLLF